ncbi:hypothetical protein Scep_023788 [Stephania cephalantha]|uniref:Uncharacterized protein n=1 Tax=Stephania cephalantha TaxID=152367 RepID=A0AAP0F2G2_9MAGN
MTDAARTTSVPAAAAVWRRELRPADERTSRGCGVLQQQRRGIQQRDAGEVAVTPARLLQRRSDAGEGQRRRDNGSDRQRRTSGDATQRGGTHQRRRRPATSGAGDRRATTWLRRDERRGDALLTGRMRDFVEIATTRWSESIGKRVMVTGYLRYEKVRAGRQGPRPKPELSLNCCRSSESIGKRVMVTGYLRYEKDVALTYIDRRRQMVCSLLGGLGGAQLVTKEPSLSRRSLALQSGINLTSIASSRFRRNRASDRSTTLHRAVHRVAATPLLVGAACPSPALPLSLAGALPVPRRRFCGSRAIPDAGAPLAPFAAALATVTGVGLLAPLRHPPSRLFVTGPSLRRRYLAGTALLSAASA